MGLTDRFRFFSGYRTRVKRLQSAGRRAPATVVEISKSGHTVNSSGTDISDIWNLDWTPDVGSYEVRKAKLRVRPEGEPEFEVEQKFRFGDFGEYVPKEGAEIEVLYDPEDHEEIVVAPPTAEQEAVRTAEALSKAKIGFTVGGHGAKPGTDDPLSDETMAKHQKSMDDASAMLKQAEQFMGGAKKEDEDEEK